MCNYIEIDGHGSLKTCVCNKSQYYTFVWGREFVPALYKVENIRDCIRQFSVPVASSSVTPGNT